MGLMNLFRSGPHRKPPTKAETAREATQQRHNKSAKLQTALEGIFTRSLKELDAREIERVDQYWGEKMKLGGKPSGKGTSHSDLIVADNVEINTPTTSSPGALTVAALGIAAAAGTAWLFGDKIVEAIKPEPTKPPIVEVKPPTVEVDDLKLRVRWWVDENGELRTKVEEIPETD